MILSKKAIKEAFESGLWKFETTNRSMPNPEIGINSVDVHLSRFIYSQKYDQLITVVDGYKLAPQEFVLGATCESIDCAAPLDINNAKRYFIQQIEGTSSLARLGLAVHITASYSSYGFCNAFTLEIVNLSNKDIVLSHGIAIGQIYFHEISEPEEAYSKDAYYNQKLTYNGYGLEENLPIHSKFTSQLRRNLKNE